MNLMRDIRRTNAMVRRSIKAAEPPPDSEPNNVSVYEYQDPTDWYDLMATWARVMLAVITVAFVAGYCWVFFTLAFK